MTGNHGVVLTRFGLLLSPRFFFGTQASSSLINSPWTRLARKLEVIHSLFSARKVFHFVHYNSQWMLSSVCNDFFVMCFRCV